MAKTKNLICEKETLVAKKKKKTYSFKLQRNIVHLSALSGYHCVYNRVEAPCNFAPEIGLYR